MHGWNINFVLEWPIFSCHVSFRECSLSHYQQGFIYPRWLFGILPVWSFIGRVCVKWTRYRHIGWVITPLVGTWCLLRNDFQKRFPPWNLTYVLPKIAYVKGNTLKTHHFSVSMLNLRRTFLKLPGVVGVPEGFSNLGFSTRQSPEDRVVGFRNGLGNSECRAGSSGNSPSIKPYFLVEGVALAGWAP